MIDTSTFDSDESRWGDIFNTLKRNGFDVYAPGVKAGECTAPYVVVKDGGTNRHATVSSDVALYVVMCYVPKQKYSLLEPFVNSVRKAMNSIEPMLLYDGSLTPSFYDDSVKAHMVSINYRNYRKLT